MSIKVSFKIWDEIVKMLKLETNKYSKAQNDKNTWKLYPVFIIMNPEFFKIKILLWSKNWTKIIIKVINKENILRGAKDKNE